MHNKNTKAVKDPGRSTVDKPAVIIVEDPRGGTVTLDAEHHIVADDGTVSVYLTDRSAGIDMQCDRGNCVILRSEKARDAFDTNTSDDDQEKELVADGGRDTYKSECNGHNCIAPAMDSESDLCRTCRERQVAKESMGRFDDDEDVDTGIDLPDSLTGDDDLIADGGRLIGAPITRTNPSRRDHGNQHYCETRAKIVYCGRLECPYCGADDDDQEDSDDDQDLIADGGSEIVNGGSVLHAEEQWRVARVGEDQVEIYQLGHGSLIVPISTVEPVPTPGVQA